LHLRIVIVVLAGCVIGSAGLASATARKTTHQTALKKSTPHKATPVRKTTAAAKKKTAGTRRAKNSRTARRVPRRSWRAGQMAPTPERYKEIQEALVKKGYLHEDATGKWDEASAGALRRFQQEQNLEPTGTLDSLSIIALGLGPKYEATAGKTAAPQP
jgi:peptidoglycan hydrolase-like protein with peptidoglycan-binding domain